MMTNAFGSGHFMNTSQKLASNSTNLHNLPLPLKMFEIPTKLPQAAGAQSAAAMVAVASLISEIDGLLGELEAKEVEADGPP